MSILIRGMNDDFGDGYYCINPDNTMSRIIYSKGKEDKQNAEKAGDFQNNAGDKGCGAVCG